MMDKANILVVDDELGPRESLRMALKPYYRVYTAEGWRGVAELLNQVDFDLVTLDLKMPDITGTRLLERVKQHNPDIEAIIITGYASMDTAVAGLRLGAFDYLEKPFDVRRLLGLVQRALERRHARQRLRQLKSDFLANVSHELRTPLSVVMGFVSLLLEESGGGLTLQQQEILEKVYESSEDLLELVDNLLYLSFLDAGHLSRAEVEVDLIALLKEVLKKYEKRAVEKGIRLNFELPPGEIRLATDRVKLARILDNILHNAVKFTLVGQIAVKLHESGRRQVIDIEVIDDGIGIPDDQIEAMFRPFHQLDSSPTRQFSGLGLGLAVGRRLSEFLGGKLELRSQLGVGTHVLLSLPLGPAPAGQTDPRLH